MKGEIIIEVITRGRGQGKTYDLIMESARTGNPIVTPFDSRYIVDKARELGVKIRQPMTIYEYKLFRRNNSLANNPAWKGKILVDEVDSLLYQLLEANVEKATLTPDSMKNKNLWKAEYECIWNKDENNNSSAISENGGNKEDMVKITANEITLSDVTRIDHTCTVIEVSIIVPNKVVEVIFTDESKEKVVCKKPDVFSLEKAIAICLAKKLYRKDYTPDGIEYMARQLLLKKDTYKIIKDGLKLYDEKVKTEEERMAAKKAEQSRIEKKRTKRDAYKERRLNKLAEEETVRLQAEKEEMIEIQKEAYVRAMEILNGGTK